MRIIRILFGIIVILCLFQFSIESLPDRRYPKSTKNPSSRIKGRRSFRQNPNIRDAKTRNRGHISKNMKNTKKVSQNKRNRFTKRHNPIIKNPPPFCQESSRTPYPECHKLFLECSALYFNHQVGLANLRLSKMQPIKKKKRSTEKLIRELYEGEKSLTDDFCLEFRSHRQLLVKFTNMAFLKSRKSKMMMHVIKSNDNRCQ